MACSIKYGTHSTVSFTPSVFLSILTRNLADHDKDGRLTAEEFIVAMHCCDMARAGQPLPLQLPDEWLHAPVERTEPASKSDGTSTTYAQLNQQLKETITASEESKGNAASEEMTEAEQKSAQITYEDKRLKNYEVRRSNDLCSPFAHCSVV